MKQKHFNSTPAKLMDEILQARLLYKAKNGEFPTLVYLSVTLLPALFHYSEQNPQDKHLQVDKKKTTMKIKGMDVFFQNNLPHDEFFMCVPQWMKMNAKLFVERDLEKEEENRQKRIKAKSNGEVINLGAERPKETDSKASGAGKQNNRARRLIKVLRKAIGR